MICAGSSEIYIYFTHIKQMIQFGPYGPNHATAGTFAFRAELLKQTKYQDHAAVAEEREFLKGYTVPFVQLDPMKTILCFSHEQNTFDKRKLLANPHPDYVKESKKKVSDFIKLDKEAPIKKFFMEEIDPLLEKYEPGKPEMKPDVLKQIAQIEADREKMIQEEMAKNGQIMLNQPGKPPIALTMPQVAEMLQKQGEQLQIYERRIQELENINAQLQRLLSAKQAPLAQGPFAQAPLAQAPQTLPNPIFGPALPPKFTPNPIVIGEASKSEPLFKI